MKKIIFSFLLVLFSIGAFAVPYHGQPYEFTQPDGTKVTVLLYGDEYYTRAESIDGYTLVRDEVTGWISYADVSSDKTKFVSTGKKYHGKPVDELNGSDKPNVSKHIDLPLSSRQKIAKESNLRLNGKNEIPGSMTSSPAPGDAAKGGVTYVTPGSEAIIGDIKGLTILVDFSDQPATIPASEFEGYLNGDNYTNYGNNGSLKKYFQDVSGGLLNYTNTIYGYYRAPKTFAQYDAMSYTTGAQEILLAALQKMDSEGFDFSTLTTKGGRITAINLIYTGVPPTWAQGMWHHKGWYPNFTADGVSTGDYNTSPANGPLKMGVLVHENGHMIGKWPDTYKYDSANGVDGIGKFDLMCDTYGNGGLNPAPPNPYFLYTAGWTNIVDVTSLNGAITDVSNSNTLYRYKKSSTEFFLLKARKKEGRSAHIPDEGLTIWHVSTTGNNQNLHSNTTPHQVYLEHANNNINDHTGACWHTGGNVSFNDTTIPNALWYDTTSSGLKVSNVSVAGTTMTYNIGNATPTADCNGQVGGLAWIDDCGVCSGGNTGIATNGTCNFYCNPTATGTGSDWIKNVTFGTVNNTTVQTQYSNFTNLSSTYSSGNIIPVSVTMNYAFAADKAYAWVDWNDNGTFEDTERTNFPAFTVGSNSKSTANITVPAVVSGNYRMRVRAIYGTTADPCGNYGGETEDYTLVINGSLSSYAITYNGNGSTGGTIPAFQTKIQGQSIVLANNTGDLVKSGFTFSGWNTAADGSGTNYAVGATYTTDAALALYAKWIATNYTITYNGNGNTSGTAPASQTKSPGVSITLATNSGTLARTGYTFAGWNTQADGLGTNYAAGATYTTDASLALFAKWTPLTYAVTYNGNTNTGGTVPASQTKTYGVNLTLASNSGNLVKTGHTFSGWNTAANGTGTNYAVGATYSGNAALTLYAKWVKNTYPVTYNGNSNTGGTAPASQTKTYGVNLTLATNSGALVRTGYTFAGWNTAANGTGTNYAAGATYTGNAALTLYAKWTPLTYTVTYNGNTNTGGTVPANQTKTYGVNLTLASNTGNLVKTGFTFAGWNTLANGTGTDYAVGATYTGNAALTLYAKWVASTTTYPITYNGNGNTGGTAPASQTKSAGVSITLATNSGALVRTGYTFAGWNTAVDGTGTNYAAGATYTTDAALTLYAKWNLNTYAITYNGNGNTGGTVPATQTKNHGSSIVLASNTGNLVKSGSTFVGWNTAANGTGTDYAVGATYTADAAVTLYAKWTALPTYAITYNGNGNTSGTAPATQNKTQGVSITLASNSGSLAKTGSIFAGWNTAADGTGTNYAVGATYTTDAALTLYAKWTVAATYAITYNGNGNTSGTAPANQTKTQGVSIALASNSGSLAKTGNTFAGWNTAADGTGTNYAEGASYTTDAALTLYAKWTTASQTPTNLAYLKLPTSNFSSTVSKLTDGNRTNFYTWSMTMPTAYAEIDLGGMYDISKFDVYTYSQFTGMQYTIQVKSALSDTYTTVVDRSASTLAASLISDNVTVTGRYVRFNVLDCFNNAYSTAYVNELEVYGVASAGAKTASTKVSSVQDETLKSISIYPNPVKGGVLNLKLEGYGDISKVKMYDITGRLTYTKSGLNQSEVSINVSNFETGIYFLKVQAGAEMISKKVIIE